MNVYIYLLNIAFQCEHQLSYNDGRLESVKWYKVTIQDTVADGEVTEPHISDHEWRHKMGQFLHIHPGGAGEGEEADPAQDGRNKYSGKISTQYKQWMLCYKTPKKALQ